MPSLSKADLAARDVAFTKALHDLMLAAMEMYPPDVIASGHHNGLALSIITRALYGSATVSDVATEALIDKWVLRGRDAGRAYRKQQRERG